MPYSASALEPSGSYREWDSAANLAITHVGGRMLRLISARASIRVLVIDDLLLRLAVALCATCSVST